MVFDKMSSPQGLKEITEDERVINIIDRPDRKLQKKIILRGDYQLFPREGAKVEVSLSEVSFSDENGPCDVDNPSRYFKTDFDGKFEIGEADYYLDEDLEHCLKLMSCGEINRLHFEYRDINGKLGRRVACRVHLLNTSNEQLISDWEWSRLYAQAKRYKECGVKLVRQHRTWDAFRRFSKAYKLTVSIEPYDPETIPPEHVDDVKKLKINLLNNLAHCQLYFKEFIPTVNICNSVLEMDCDNIKALYRRGTARIGLEEWEAAYKDLQRVIQAEPNNKEARAKMEVVKPHYKVVMDNYTSVIKKMFS